MESLIMALKPAIKEKLSRRILSPFSLGMRAWYHRTCTGPKSCLKPLGHRERAGGGTHVDKLRYLIILQEF